MHRIIRRLRPRAAAAAAALAVVLGAALAPPTALAQGPLTGVATLSLGARAHEVVVSGPLAYVGTATGVSIVNVSNPAAPTVVGTLQTSKKTLGMALSGNTLFLAAHSGDLKVVDVSDPTAPQLLVTKSIPSYAWDVAVKGNIVYVASFGGEIYVLDASNPASPVLIKTIGVLAWHAASGDAKNLAKMNEPVTAGNAKVTGVSVAGNRLFAVDWNYGRFYMWDITNPANPVFAGTHYAAFTYRSEGDPAGENAYILAAFGNSSGIYSVPLALMGPDHSTRHQTCDVCDYFQSPATDYGGLAVSANSRYVVYVAGKVGEVRVLDVSDPSDMKSVGVVPVGRFGVKTGDALGVALQGDFIYVAAGNLGFQIYRFPGLSN